jgi:putative nucleotidyltransferase with HDIG domain
MVVEQHYIGKRIMKDISTSTGVLVLSDHTLLNEFHLQKLRNHNVDLSELDIAIDPLSVQIDSQARYLKDVFERTRYTNQLPILEMKSKLIPELLPLCNEVDFFRMVRNIKVTDEYLYRHSIGVGVLAATIGKWMQLDESLIPQLLLAGILHDIGKVKVEDSILDKPGSLNAGESEQMMKHTVWGYEILKGTVGISNRIALVALQHHEREDGSGYPHGLKADEIDLFSKIVSVADVFHAMLSERAHQPGLSSMLIVNHFAEQVYSKLNSPVLLIFFKRFFSHLLGRKVVLSDGSIGKVIYLNPYEFLRPLVQQETDYIDLAKRRDLSLLEVI